MVKAVDGPKTIPVQLYVSEAWLARVDDWRRGQDDLPGRSEAIRRLVDLGLTVKPPRKGK